MMLMKKDKALLSMKFIGVLFLAFMFTTSVKFIVEMTFESLEEINESNQINLDEDICNTYYLFLMYAFVLGAFWNVKKIRKVGIV